MEGFPSYERHRTVDNVATPLVVIVGATIVLQNEQMDDEGEGIVGPIRTGELLSRFRLHPNDVVIQVTAIFSSITPVWEPLKDTLGECMGCTLQWPRARLNQRFGAPTVDATYVASMFEFSGHDCENACTPPVQPTVIGSNQPIGSSRHDSNQTLIPIIVVPFVDGLSSNSQRCTYTYRNGDK